MLHAVARDGGFLGLQNPTERAAMAPVFGSGVDATRATQNSESRYSGIDHKSDFDDGFDLDGFAIGESRLVFPATDRVEGGFRENRVARNDGKFFDGTVFGDENMELNDALQSFFSGLFGVARIRRRFLDQFCLENILRQCNARGAELGPKGRSQKNNENGDDVTNSDGTKEWIEWHGSPPGEIVSGLRKFFVIFIIRGSVGNGPVAENRRDVAKSGDRFLAMAANRKVLTKFFRPS